MKPLRMKNGVHGLDVKFSQHVLDLSEGRIVVEDRPALHHLAEVELLVGVTELLEPFLQLRGLLEAFPHSFKLGVVWVAVEHGATNVPLGGFACAVWTHARVGEHG